MEHIAIEKGAYELIGERIAKLKRNVNELYPKEKSALEEGWIENSELRRRLNISIRTLQTYRERGIIGFSMIGRKIYYKISDIEHLIACNRIVGDSTHTFKK